MDFTIRLVAFKFPRALSYSLVIMVLLLKNPVFSIFIDSLFLISQAINYFKFFLLSGLSSSTELFILVFSFMLELSLDLLSIVFNDYTHKKLLSSLYMSGVFD